MDVTRIHVRADARFFEQSLQQLALNDSAAALEEFLNYLVKTMGLPPHDAYLLVQSLGNFQTTILADAAYLQDQTPLGRQTSTFVDAWFQVDRI
mmetsp:Transcript_35856/g.100884  ORF Transcript_35856/g.100884 Transcript_35856/m.100884 type:complete len:94 (-) Transcript_35856:134-415(-)|eukprot:CAMPEP_0119143992 /NCGR_PEP_ID=MMETSP1310-20130426/35182_1 /TAXON_ID=464262 /ORGANISM="Genus nov. species nov., Strain RCC2339" /LENGTH=93 /DNA_ID=CAMNT_0007135671 /DNA_START=136 /DNA_END=417 /DNA_ORIENTATION=-